MFSSIFIQFIPLFFQSNLFFNGSILFIFR
nr:MAG TPA: hypothetical protein [Caudoviricetes sp.]